MITDKTALIVTLQTLDCKVRTDQVKLAIKLYSKYNRSVLRELVNLPVSRFI